MRTWILILAAVAQLSSSVLLIPAAIPRILPLREQAELRDHWLQLRLERILPSLMDRTGAEMWIVISREYNEDPLFRTLAPATWLAARRRTILVFSKPRGEDRVERLAVARYDVGNVFPRAWDPETQPDQWRRLGEIVQERDPATIAVNTSADFALADGLSRHEGEALEKALGQRYRKRLISGEKLAVGWLETRIEEELEIYPSICGIAHEIIREGLSNQVIQPGYTTTGDVEWWFRERVRGLGLETWFHPTVSLQRAGEEENDGSFASRPESNVISRGDLLHVDFGISYLGLNTDTQQHAYVLRAGEEEAPEELRKALGHGNRLQDILTAEFVIGRTGNEILLAALSKARSEGLEASIYTHPLGFHGHGAGPTIGMWDRQEGVPGPGDYPLYPDTVFSIELNVAVEIAAWEGKKIRIMLEEDAVFDGAQVRYLDGRQENLLLVP